MTVTIDALTFEDMCFRIEELEANIKELFVLLERTEQTDEGRLFHPVRIYCIREMDRVKLEQVLRKLKGDKT